MLSVMRCAMPYWIGGICLGPRLCECCLILMLFERWRKFRPLPSQEGPYNAIDPLGTCIDTLQLYICCAPTANAAEYLHYQHAKQKVIVCQVPTNRLLEM